LPVIPREPPWERAHEGHAPRSPDPRAYARASLANLQAVDVDVRVSEQFPVSQRALRRSRGSSDRPSGMARPALVRTRRHCTVGQRRVRSVPAPPDRSSRNDPAREVPLSGERRARWLPWQPSATLAIPFALVSRSYTATLCLNHPAQVGRYKRVDERAGCL
jgi:hypothetical protein